MKDETNRKCRKTTDASRAKATGKWRKATRRDGQVLVDPNGKVYHGTRQEIRDAALTPCQRNSLADRIKTNRHVWCKDCDLDWLKDINAEARRDAIEFFNRASDLRSPYGFTTLEEVEIEAAARYMGWTFSEFCRDAILTAIDAAKDLSGGEIPLTRYEQKALSKVEA